MATPLATTEHKMNRPRSCRHWPVQEVGRDGLAICILDSNALTHGTSLYKELFKRFCTSALEACPARPTVVSRLLILACGEFCTAIGTKNITMISVIAARKENNTIRSRFIGPFFSLSSTAAENVFGILNPYRSSRSINEGITPVATKSPKTLPFSTPRCSNLKIVWVVIAAALHTANFGKLDDLSAAVAETRQLHNNV